MNKFHIYLHFPKEGLEYQIVSEQIGIDFLYSVRMLIDRADCETGANLYFEGSNKDAFFDTLSVIEEIYQIGNFGILDTRTVIDKLLYDADAKDWESNPSYPLSEGDCLYRLWDLDARKLLDSFPNVLKEIAEKEFRFAENNQKEGCLLLNIGNEISTNRDFFPVFKDCRNNSQNKFPKFIYVKYASDFKELENWLDKNREPRNYNVNDNRHVEGHLQYISGKSPILDGQDGKPRLEELLKTALTDQRDAPHAAKDLMNFDDLKNEHVWYESEGSSNQYHGYHLVKRETDKNGKWIDPPKYEIDLTAVNKIPERVRDILEYRKSIKV